MGGTTSQRPSNEPLPNAPLYVMGALMAAGAIVAFSSGIAGTGGGIRPALLMLGLIGATALVGGFVGFLFGLPRFDYAAREAAARSPSTADSPVAGVPTAAAAPGDAPVHYKPNANLDEIADWLTKIIVGLGLTQLLNVGPALRSVSAYVVTECGQGCPPQPLVGAMIVYGALAGLLFGYLWTRLRYVKLAAVTDIEATDILRSFDYKAAAEFGVGGIKGLDVQVDATGKTVSSSLDDPNKGNFGGQAINNDRALRATIDPSELGAGLYRVVLTVTSTDIRKPLRGRVTFYLHPTFQPDVVERDVVNGVATLGLVAYGAFTVGARADGGKTELELDLAQHPDATPDFRSR